MSSLRGPREVPHLRGPDVLIEARAADGRAFLAAGPRAVVWGTGLRGVRSVFVGEQPILEGLTTSAGVCTNLLLSPGRARRELATPGTMWIEDIMVLPAHPCAVLQWTPQSPCRGQFTIAWDIPGVDSSMCSTEGSFLQVEAEGGASLVFFVTPEPEAWTVEGRADGVRVTVRVNSTAEDSITLATLREQDAERIQPTLDALEHLRAYETRLSTELEEACRNALTLGSGVQEVDTGFEWSKARLRSALQGGAKEKSSYLGLITATSPGGPARCEPSTGSDLLWTVLGWLATGDFTAAEQGVRALIGHRAFGWACGLYASWSGDDRILTDLATPLSDWISLVAGSAGPPSAGYGVRGHLALAVAHDGRRDAAAATAHRLEAEAIGSIPRPFVPTRTEPPDTVSGDPALLAGRLGLGPSEGPLGDPDDGYTLWQNLVITGAREAGVWASPPGTTSHRTALAALIPAGMLFGILGAEAEAAAGRLHLAPRLPMHVSNFRVENIRVGTAFVRLTYEREDRRHTYRAEQSEGATPINLVLNLRLKTNSAGEAFVDGAPAELDWKPEPAGMMSIQIQLPLDAVRTVTLEVPEIGDGSI